MYWEVKHDTNGKVVVMVAQKEKAISAATRNWSLGVITLLP